MEGRLADRWKVITYRNDGKTVAQIKRLTDFTWTFVSRWAGRADKGLGADDLSRQGRPREVTPTIAKRITRAMEDQQRKSTRKMGAKFGFSPETVRTVAIRGGLKPYHQQRRQLLTDQHRRKRFWFARKFAKFDWRRVMFTDEKLFPLWHKRNSKNDVVWAKCIDNVPKCQRPAFSPGIMVWGGITYYGKTPLIRVEGTLNTASFAPIVRRGATAANRLFGNERWWWQQDGAKPHTSKESQQLLLSTVPALITKAEWPANSPDANPIENLWSIMADKVAVLEPRTMDDLWKAIQTAWRQIPVETVQKLIDSQRERLLAIRRAKGGWTKY